MKLSIKEMTRVALFTSLISIASLILKIGGEMVVPFSILPFMVMLAGAILGPFLGAVSVTVYVLLGLAGVPVLAKPPFGGAAYVLQPTFGFLPGFIAMAYVIGLILKRFPQRSLMQMILAMTAGIAVMYFIGIPYLFMIIRFYLGRPFTLINALEIGLLPFIFLDLLKGVLASFVARILLKRLNI